VRVFRPCCWPRRGGFGTPSGSETFTQAYDKAVAGNAFSPLPCIKVKGRWYVNGSA